MTEMQRAITEIAMPIKSINEKPYVVKMILAFNYIPLCKLAKGNKYYCCRRFVASDGMKTAFAPS